MWLELEERRSPMAALVAGYLLIFSARIFDVTLATLRVLLLVRGKRVVAGTLGFFEVIIYILALKFVVDRLGDPLSLVSYGLGFATGNVVGSLVEEKIAFGLLTVQVISVSCSEQLTRDLRLAGFGVTTWEAQGREGCHHVLHVILPRKQMGRLTDIINQWDPGSFVTVFDARSVKGGVFSRKAK